MDHKEEKKLNRSLEFRSKAREDLGGRETVEKEEEEEEEEVEVEREEERED
jgi:hypothetical protein